MDKSDNDGVVNFLFEIGILNKTPRSGFQFLGTGQQSVAEHVCRTVFVGFALAKLDKTVNLEKVLKMCLLHDLEESRTSDLNYVHQKYTEKQGDKAVSDLASGLPFGNDLKEIIGEYEERRSKEAILAKDADNLEWILSLKEQLDCGNKRAKEWIEIAIKRLKTEAAILLAGRIQVTDSSNWWFAEKGDQWWVSRNRKTQ